jgi:hypothetical protein
MYKEAMTLDYPDTCRDCMWRLYSAYEDVEYCTLRHHQIRLWGTCEDFDRNNLTSPDYSV